MWSVSLASTSSIALAPSSLPSALAVKTSDASACIRRLNSANVIFMLTLGSGAASRDDSRDRFNTSTGRIGLGTGGGGAEGDACSGKKDRGSLYGGALAVLCLACDGGCTDPVSNVLLGGDPEASIWLLCC